MEPLEASKIAARLGRADDGRADVEVRVAAQCASTNAVLLAEQPRHPVLLAAEAQTAGRGRRGRRWHSSPGAGATFTLARRMRCGAQGLAGLSLAVGVAAARALRSLGASGVTLKWPNDLLVGGAKLGGILIETRSSARSVEAGKQAGILVAVGIGINCRPVGALANRLGRRVAALDELVQPPLPRNAVVGAVAGEVAAALDAFEREGLAAFADEWRSLHAFEGRRLRVRLDGGASVSGIAEGLAPGGALRLRTRGGLRDIAAGRIEIPAPRRAGVARAAEARR